MVDMNHTNVWLLGEILIQQGLISWAQLDEALEEQKENGRLTGEILVEKGMVSNPRVYQALAIQAGLKYVVLGELRPEKTALEIVPRRLIYQHRILPLIKKGQTLMIAICNPLRPWPEEELKSLTQVSDVRLVLCCPEDLEEALNRYFGPESISV